MIQTRKRCSLAPRPPQSESVFGEKHMSILKYLGPFAKEDGRVITETTALCKCDWCSREWMSKVRTLKRYKHDLPLGSICRICSERGMPVRLEDVARLYPRIISARGTSARGGHVRGDTYLSFKCMDCGGVHWAKYDVVRRDGFSWRCASCRRRFARGADLVYPLDVPDLISWDADTLGLTGQLSEKTVVTFLCESCRRPMTTRWGYFRKRGRTGKRQCGSCGQAEMPSEESRKRHSEFIRQKWADPEYRDKVLAARSNAERNYTSTMSGAHRRFKKFLEQSGFRQFVSEQWVARGVRVDEVDFESKKVVEFYGDYFHANPSRFGADDILIFPSGKVAARAVWEHDRERLEYLESLGYGVLIVWESEFRSVSEQVLEKLRQFAKT